MRAQANLPALAVALLVVSTTTGLAVVIADGAFASAQRDATERATATAIADRLTAPDSPTTARRNVLTHSRLTAAVLADVVPAGTDVRIAVDGDVVFERGDPTGPTARRLVLVAERQRVTIEPPLKFETVTLPRRSPRATIRIEPAADVDTVRANDRVVLHDPAGITGAHDVALSRYETTTLRFEGDVDAGEVEVTYYPRQTTKGRLEVTVDA
jgi:hypothetical protein